MTTRAPAVLINDDNDDADDDDADVDDADDDDADDDDGNLELVSPSIFTTVQLPPPKSTVLR